VHSIEDQCAFIQRYCDDEEAGLVSYLQLYYCRLPHVKPIAFMIMVSWLAILFSTIGITASDYFSVSIAITFLMDISNFKVNLSTISALLGFSESITGVTFLAFGNGSPDVFSTFAAMSTNSGSLAIGELIGAAGFIVAVVAGSMALVRPFKVARKSFLRDVGFFIVAAAFSMVFLLDGHLQLWECIAMVAFYAFYVVVIVFWQWRAGKRKRRKAREAQARDHFLAPEGTEGFTLEEDEDQAVSHTFRASSIDEFTALERSEGFGQGEDNEDDDTRDRYMAEISRNMRIARPGQGSRQNTRNPIRPSLVGALEFRALLSSLERSRTQQGYPINLRRYSDDPSYTLAQQRVANQSASALGSSPRSNHQQLLTEPYRDEDNRRRQRAVSTNDLEDPKRRNNNLAIPQTGKSTNIPSSSSSRAETSSSVTTQLLIPVTNESHSSSSYQERDDLLSPATAEDRRNSTQRNPLSAATSPSTLNTVLYRPRDNLEVPILTDREFTRSPSPELASPLSGHSSPIIEFPQYFDDPQHETRILQPSSLRLPPPGLDQTSMNGSLTLQKPAPKLVNWWPYKILPPPSVLLSTLFPTLCSWSEKSYIQRIIAVVTAPSVFLLTITLPVVEAAKEEEETNIHTHDLALSHETLSIPSYTPNTQSSNGENHHSAASQLRNGSINGLSPGSRPAVVVTNPSENIIQHQQSESHNSQAWNRWLLCVQVFMAPFFVVLIVWANIDDGLSPRNLFIWTAYAMIGSLLSLLIILLTTEEQKPPKYQPIFCFMGFIVSIAWISTIANEVVGVLKAVGVILNISEAILGLTVFAVGNR
jgi:solute carrier family 24 (sodium/potassium/calcium exchanger), member 6